MGYQVLSASASERADLCEGSFALDYEYSDGNDFFAYRGTQVHKYLEAYFNSPEEGDAFIAFQNSEYIRCLCNAVKASEIFAELRGIAVDSVQEYTEQKFWINGDEAAKLLPKSLKSRDYPNIDGFGGTVDWLSVGDDRVYVADYKTGIAKNAESSQMRVLAGMAYEVFDKPVTTIIVSIPAAKFPAKAQRIKWYNHVLEHTIYTKEYDVNETRGCAEYARDIYSRVRQQRRNRSLNLPLTLKRDDKVQCRYCNSKSFCEEWK